jgi:hypothetical protein
VQEARKRAEKKPKPHQHVPIHLNGDPQTEKKHQKTKLNGKQRCKTKTKMQNFQWGAAPT